MSKLQHNKIKIAQQFKSVIEKVENLFGKGEENAGY